MTDFAPLVALAIPAAGALLVPWLGRWPNLRETVSLLTAAILTAFVVGSLLPAVLDGARPEVSLWQVLPGVSLAFRVEPLGMFYALVASSLWIVTTLYAIGYMRANREHAQTRFYTCFALAIFSSMGIAFAGNLFTLFVFYELLTLSTFPLVTHKGTEDAVRAGRTYLGILLTTSICFLLFGILWTFSITQDVDFKVGGVFGSDVDSGTIGLIFFLFVFGIGKAALMPVHRWLPAAMVAPTPVSALLHAVAVVKAGVFTLAKVTYYTFGIDTLAQLSEAQWLAYAAGGTIVLASIIALYQNNLKRRLAYSTISQLAYIILATALFAPISMLAAVLHIVAHAVGKITLFFAAGCIYTAHHKTEVSQLDGIGRRMPVTMTAFAIGTLSMIGLPPAAGFVSKWYLLQASWQTEHWFAIGVIFLSALLNAGYFLPIVLRAFFKRPPEGGDEGIAEAPWTMQLAIGTTAAATVAFFFFPEPFIALGRELLKGV